MNKREKILAGIVGGLVSLFAAVFLWRALMVWPLEEIDRQTRAIRGKIEEVNEQQRAFFAAENYLKKINARTFADDVDEASARLGEIMTRTIMEAGLEEREFSRLPAGPRRLRGAQEVGWSVQGEGSFSKVIDLLFLLETDPHLHRMEGLVLSDSDERGRVRVRFRYLTLVLNPAPLTERKELKRDKDLGSEERLGLQGIVERDLLKPYVKMPPPAPKEETKPAPAVPDAPSGPTPDQFKVVSLSEWAGEAEVHVRDLKNNEVRQLAAGDELFGGRIVGVDYRALPMPGKPYLMSHSRVILKENGGYWAVERGQTLAEKRALREDELPRGLR